MRFCFCCEHSTWVFLACKWIHVDRWSHPCFLWRGERNIYRNPAGTDDDDEWAGEDHFRQNVWRKGCSKWEHCGVCFFFFLCNFISRVAKNCLAIPLWREENSIHFWTWLQFFFVVLLLNIWMNVFCFLHTCGILQLAVCSAKQGKIILLRFMIFYITLFFGNAMKFHAFTITSTYTLCFP